MKTKTTNRPVLIVPKKMTLKAMDNFHVELENLFSDSNENLYLDCSNLEQITSSHINALWIAHQRCREVGQEALLVATSPELIRVLRVLDLYELFSFDREHERQNFSPMLLETFPETYADEFSCNSDSTSEALERFLDYLKQLLLPECTVSVLRTIFYEIAINISDHSGLEEHELVVFTASADREKITMVFADSGKPFNIMEQIKKYDPKLARKSKQRRGFGVVLFSKLADKIQYVRENNALNILIVEKQW